MLDTGYWMMMRDDGYLIVNLHSFRLSAFGFLLLAFCFRLSALGFLL